MRLSAAVQILVLWSALGVWSHFALDSRPIESQPHAVSSAQHVTAVKTPAVPMPTSSAGIAGAGRLMRVDPQACYYARLNARSDMSRDTLVAMLAIAEGSEESLMPGD